MATRPIKGGRAFDSAVSPTSQPFGSTAVAGASNFAAPIDHRHANPKVFISAEATGTGSAQNIAHGLGAAPTAVLVAPTDTAPATVGVYTCVEGTHTSTNVVVTVTSGKKFKVMAYLNPA